MRSKTFIFLPVFLLVIFGISSCYRYIDATNGDTVIEQGSLKFYSDSNLFAYKTNIIATRDKEMIYPKYFEVTLPKKIKYYEFINSTDFGFYYEKGQVIFIKIELDSKIQSKDTTYIPSTEKLDEFIQLVIKTNGKKLDIKKITASKGRRNFIIIKGDATILLYNITNDNLKQFLDDLSSFKFIN